MKQSYALLIGLLLFATPASAQVPSMIKNVDTVTVDVFSGSFPKKGIELNGSFYFPATNNNGEELWKTDGTSAGTAQLKDIASIFDREDGSPRLFMPMGDSLFFLGRSGLHLYKYVPATGKITEMPGGKDEAYTATEAVTAGDNIFFAGDGYFGQGVELFRYNIVSTSLDVYDVSPDTFSSYPHNLTVVGDTVYFAATDTTNGTELWLYDPVNDNVQLVSDIAPGVASSNPSDLIAAGSTLFFTATDTVNGRELWSTDGATSITQMYADINTDPNADSEPAHKTLFNGKVFFSANDGINGNELWMTDPANATTQMVADINPFGDANPGITGFKAVGSLLYFAADDGNDGIELWSMDSIGLSPALVKDLNTSGDSHPRDMYNLGDTLIFVANNGNGWQIWKSDNTASGTSIIQSIQPAGADTIHVSGIGNNRVYFGADDGAHGVELWKTGGSALTTAMVKDINYGSGISSEPQWFEPFNSAMYFNAKTSPDYWFSLYKTDGTSSGTVEVRHGSIDSNFSAGPFHPLALGGELIFSAFTDTTGFELWKTDGTRAGTVRIKSIYPGPTGSDPNNFTVLGSNMYFTANDGTNGTELWKTDGTLSGTSLVKDIRSGSAGSEISDMTVANNKLFFLADDGTAGRELWASDGTTSGTALVKDIRSGSTSSSPGNLFSAGSLLYFQANDGTNGAEAWTSDGTANGTTMLKDINVGVASSEAGSFAKLGSWVYFAAKDTTNNETKLWRTDGTAANTSRFFNVNFPFLLTNIGSRLVFMAFPAGSTNGFHMWSTNGTTAGTMEIEDFQPGEVGYFLIDNFPVHNSRVFFWIDDNISGQELWTSDGTASGTVKYDIAPGAASSYPRNGKGLNPLIFSADDGSINGKEPWMLNLPVPLGIEGLEFSAEKRGVTAFLEWKNLASVATDYSYEVQRSSNGLHFDAIGLVHAIAGSSTYSFTDAGPLEGRNYYRLSQKDINGASSLSEIRSVIFNTNTSVKAYPNPAADVLHINTGRSFTNGRLNVTNMNGQVVLQQDVSGSGTLDIKISQLTPGVYQTELSEGSYSLRLMFVKH